MNGFVQNLLPSADTVVLEFLVTPTLSSGSYVVPNFGFDITINSTSAQTVVVSWGDNTSTTYTGTTIYPSKTYSDSTVRRIKMKIANPLNVTSFQFQRGRVKDVYGDFRELKNLITLNFNNNDLTKVPEICFDLPKVSTLNLSQNLLNELPKTIGLQTQLVNLLLSNFRGTTFPSEIGNCTSLQVLRMRRESAAYGQVSFTFPSTFNQLTNLKELNLCDNAGSRGMKIGASLPTVLRQLTSLNTLIISRCGTFNDLSGIENLINLTSLTYEFIIVDTGGGTSLATGALPANWKNLTKLKTINAQASFIGQQARLNAQVDAYYNIVTANAPMVGTNADPWRGVTFNIAGTNQPSVSGTYQMPANYSPGVSNGNPASQREKIWVLVNQYGWTVTYN